MDNEKPSQLPAITRTEVSYLDMQGNPVDPHQAVRVITKEYDEKENLISTKMSFDPGKTSQIRPK